MGTMRLVVDAPDGGAPAEVNVERLGELLGDTRNRLWLDIGDPGAAEVALLHRVFGFHELALEEVTRSHERPRCEAYGRYYFIVVYAAESAGRLVPGTGAEPVLERELPGHDPPEDAGGAGGAGRGPASLGAP